AEKGNGFFDGRHGNQFVEKEIIAPVPICFCRGTLIATRNGEVPVEKLRLGDEVLTLDHGYQPIRWLGSRKLSALALRARPALRPVEIRDGALGAGLPTRDLRLSPQHRVLLRSKVLDRMIDTS